MTTMPPIAVDLLLSAGICSQVLSTADCMCITYSSHYIANFPICRRSFGRRSFYARGCKSLFSGNSFRP